MMAEYQKALGMDSAQQPAENEDTKEIEDIQDTREGEPTAQTVEEESNENSNCEEETEASEVRDDKLWVTDVTINPAGCKIHDLTEKRKEERRKRRAKVRRRKNEHATSDNHRYTKIVIVLAAKHPIASNQRLFVPLSCIPTSASKNSKSGEATQEQNSQTITIYSVNTEEKVGISLARLYSSYYRRARADRKKSEEAAYQVR